MHCMYSAHMYIYESLVSTSKLHKPKVKLTPVQIVENLATKCPNFAGSYHLSSLVVMITIPTELSADPFPLKRTPLHGLKLYRIPILNLVVACWVRGQIIIDHEPSMTN